MWLSEARNRVNGAMTMRWERVVGPMRKVWKSGEVEGMAMMSFVKLEELGLNGPNRQGITRIFVVGNGV